MPKRNYVLLVLVAAVVFGLSEYIEWYGDALLYRFSFASGEQVETFSEIFTSQFTHYFTMNGRIWAHVLCQGFAALWGQTVFAVCNALVYVLFVWLFAGVSGGMGTNDNGQSKPSFMLMCVLAVLVVTDTSYIPTCQIGYVWTSTATLGFILTYFRCRTEHPGAVGISLLFLLALLAGNGNEAIAIGTGAALIVDVCRQIWISRQKDERTGMKTFGLTITQWVMVTGFGIGGLLLCLSPGILRRAGGESANVVWSMYRLLCYSRMLYVLVLTLVVLKLRGRLRLRNFASDNIFFVTALVTLIVFNLIIGIGQLSGRQLFGVELFSGILTMRALRGVRVPGWILAGATIAVVGLYAMKVDYIRRSNEDLRTLRKEMSETKGLKIFMDFHHYPKIVHPSELWNNYELYVFMASAIHDDLADFGHYYYNHKVMDTHPPYYETLVIYPKVMREVMAADDKNFATKCEDGMWLVVQDMGLPKSFFLDREYNILGFRLPKEPYEVEFENKFHLDMDSARVVYSDFATPMIRNLGIRF